MICEYFPVAVERERERAKRISSADSCRHGQQLTYREKKEHAKQQEEEKGRSERLKILEVSTLQENKCMHNSFNTIDLFIPN